MIRRRAGMRSTLVRRVQPVHDGRTCRSNRHDEEDHHDGHTKQRPVGVCGDAHDGTEDDCQTGHGRGQPEPTSRRTFGDQPPRSGPCDRHADHHGEECEHVAQREADENEREHERTGDRCPGQSTLTA